MNPTTYDLPTGRQIEEAWRGVEAVLLARRRPDHHRITVIASAEELTCSRT